MTVNGKGWKSNFDIRELKEIQFCRVYKKQFAHGSMGHNIRIIVAKMADILDELEEIDGSG